MSKTYRTMEWAGSTIYYLEKPTLGVRGNREEVCNWLRQLALQANQSDWTFSRSEEKGYVTHAFVTGPLVHLQSANEKAWRDMEYISAASPDLILRLLDEIECLSAMLKDREAK